MNYNDRLNILHTTTADDLATVLDIEAGLREALVTAQHTRTSHDLDLDIEAGLHAVAPTTGTPTSLPTNTGQPGTAHSSLKLQGSVATWMTSLDDARRLALRNHPALTTFAVSMEITKAATVARNLERALNRSGLNALAGANASDLDLDFKRDIARVLSRDLVRDRDRAHKLARALACDLDLALDLARDLALKLTHARDLARDPDLTRDLNRTVDLVRDLDLDLDRARALNLDLDLNRAHDLDLARDLDVALSRDLALNRDLDRDLARNLNLDLNRKLARDLDRARHDFTAADLRNADLSQVVLTGVRWSMATKWPSEEWRNQALLDSQELGDGTYEVRSGTTNVPTHSV